MAIDLRHLRYFVAVAEEGHVTRAAERLDMQPPPLSRQIRLMERELKVQLCLCMQQPPLSQQIKAIELELDVQPFVRRPAAWN